MRSWFRVHMVVDMFSVPPLHRRARRPRVNQTASSPLDAVDPFAGQQQQMYQQQPQQQQQQQPQGQLHPQPQQQQLFQQQQHLQPGLVSPVAPCL